MSDPGNLSEVLLDVMSERDRLRVALETIRVEPHGHPHRINDPSRPAPPASCPVCRVIDELLPPDAVLAVPDPPITGGEVLTIPPEELHPFDQLADGRFIIALHSAVGARWTQMEVGFVRAECDVVYTLGGDSHCLWQPRYDETVKIPVPAEISVVRGARFPGYTCTSVGDSPELCDTCPARSR